MIYFLQAGPNGHVKIGWTKDDRTLKSRMAALQTGQHHRLLVIRQIEAERWTEGWLHGFFAGIRVAGEWFSFQPEMLTIDPPATRPARERFMPIVQRVIVPPMSDPRFTRNTVQIVLRVPRDVADEARKLAANRGETLTATIVDAMRHAWALSPPSVKVGKEIS